MYSGIAVAISFALLGLLTIAVIAYIIRSAIKDSEARHARAKSPDDDV